MRVEPLEVVELVDVVADRPLGSMRGRVRPWSMTRRGTSRGSARRRRCPSNSPFRLVLWSVPKDSSAAWYSSLAWRCDAATIRVMTRPLEATRLHWTALRRASGARLVSLDELIAHPRRSLRRGRGARRRTTSLRRSRCRDACHVAGRGAVRARRLEVVVQPGWRDGVGVLRVGLALQAVVAAPFEPLLAHHAGEPLLADANAVATQVAMNARAPIPLNAPAVRGHDLGDHPQWRVCCQGGPATRRGRCARHRGPRREVGFSAR